MRYYNYGDLEVKLAQVPQEVMEVISQVMLQCLQDQRSISLSAAALMQEHVRQLVHHLLYLALSLLQAAEEVQVDLALLKVQAVVQEAMAEAFRHKVVLQIRNNMQVAAVAAALNPVVAQEVVQEAEQSELQGLLLQAAVAVAHSLLIAEVEETADAVTTAAVVAVQDIVQATQR